MDYYIDKRNDLYRFFACRNERNCNFLASTNYNCTTVMKDGFG